MMHEATLLSLAKEAESGHLKNYKAQKTKNKTRLALLDIISVSTFCQ